MLRYSAPLRFDQSVRISTQLPSGIGPWRSSKAIMNSGVSRKSSSAADSAEQSITQTGRTKASAGMLSTAESGRSLPEIQWMGASKCVPVCSLQVKLRQYQAGPLSS